MTAAFFMIAAVTTRAAFLWYEYGQALEHGAAATRDMAHVLEEYAARTFDVNELVVEDVVDHVAAQGGAKVLAARPETARETARFLSDLAARTANNDYLMIVDPAGRPVAGSAWEVPPAVDLSDRPWFRAHTEGDRESHIGEAILSRMTHEILFTCTRAVRGAGGALDSIVQVAVRPAFIQDVSLGSDVGRGLVLSLIGDDGRLIARTGLTADQLGLTAADLLPPAVLTEAQGTAVFAPPRGGGEMMVSWRRLERWPVVVAASLPLAEILAPFDTSLRWSVLLLGVIAAVTAGLGIVGLRLAAREERALEEAEAAGRRLSAALAERDLLVRDIHHRVKNNLQVTVSLLMVQAGRFTDPAVRAAFADTQERLQSIGLLHEVLYQSDTGGRVDLAGYIRRLGGALADAYGAAERGIALDLDLTPLEIDPAKAVPFALILSEVVSNAFKHGFADGRGGRIGITLRRGGGEGTDASGAGPGNGAGDAPGLFLRIRDDGPGLAADPPRSGAVGMTLIDALVRQVGGRHRLYSDGGTVFELTVERL
ncbi:sensor histidine kinase [Rhodocista pekingensis]|uniref:histidine kinase n=1 Tax=Rhodocista pekingensis TaxID=201185 RepID=A0ABW2KSQ8_9PROT